jgi:hypothetical protein
LWQNEKQSNRKRSKEMSKRLISQGIRGWALFAMMVTTLVSSQFLATPAVAMPVCGFPAVSGDPEDALFQRCDLPPPPGWLPATGCYQGTSPQGVSCQDAGWTNCPNVNYCYGAPAAVPELEDYAAAAFLVLALTIGWQVRQRRVA